MNKTADRILNALGFWLLWVALALSAQADVDNVRTRVINVDLTGCAFIPVTEDQDLYDDAEYPHASTQPCDFQHPRCRTTDTVQEYFAEAGVSADEVVGIVAATPLGDIEPFRVNGSDPYAHVSGGIYVCPDQRVYIDIFADVNESDVVIPAIAVQLTGGRRTHFRVLLPANTPFIDEPIQSERLGGHLEDEPAGALTDENKYHLCDGLGNARGGGLRVIPVADLPYTLYNDMGGLQWAAISLGDYRDGAIARGALAYVQSYGAPRITYARNGATLRIRIQDAYNANGRNRINQIWTDHGRAGQLRAGSRNLLYSVAAGVDSADTTALIAAAGEVAHLTLVSCSVAAGQYRDEANHMQARLARGLGTRVTAWNQTVYIPNRNGRPVFAVQRGAQKVSVECFAAPRNCDLVNLKTY